MFKRVKIIINPASGQPFPILFHINQAFKDTSIDWDIHVTKNVEDIKKAAKKALRQGVDLVAVYGGDGTLMTVARELCMSDIPLAILPGGTANVMAKELGISADLTQALQLITAKKPQISKIDMGMINKTPFLIRINVGLAADIVKESKRSMKRNLGRVAYGVTAIQQAQKSETAHFDIILDGKKISTNGISLVIANSGNIGIEGLSIVHSISPSDGWLDVVVIESANLASAVEWLNTTINKTKPKGVIEHWKAKKVEVRVSPAQTIIVDDKVEKISVIKAHILPQAIKIVVPHL